MQERSASDRGATQSPAGPLSDALLTGQLPEADPHAEIIVRPMTVADTRVTAEMQLHGLPRSFVAQLGPRFLRGLHEAFLSSPYAVAFVAADRARPEQLIGFALGSTDARRHAAYVLQTSRTRLATLGIRSLLGRLDLIPRFARRRARRYVRRLFAARNGAHRLPERPEPRRTESAATGPTAVITALVVAPEGRRKGAGSALAEAFLTAATEAGSGSVMLVTRADETGAASFWKTLGWQEIDVHQNLDGDLVSSMSRGLP